jgi:seryl-tRNA synthetase
MHRHSARGNIRPKISTMPRQKSESAAFLDIYKLEIEKKRLQEELVNLEERRIQISQRLGLIAQQVAGLEGSVQTMRNDAPPTAPTTEMAPGYHPTNQTFDMLFLDY